VSFIQLTSFFIYIEREREREKERETERERERDRERERERERESVCERTNLIVSDSATGEIILGSNPDIFFP
jgi:hypothetical protein